MKLRDYQENAIEMLRNSLRTGHRMPILQLPTGAGKTATAGEIVTSATGKGKKVAFIVDRITLVDQASAHFDAIGLEHGIIQGDNPRTDYSKDFQIISAQTLARRKPWEFDLAIVDEAHCKHKAVLELSKKWDKIPFIGLTATPYTKGLGQYYDDLIMPITIHELIDQGHLVDADAYAYSAPDMTGVKTSGGDFNQKQAAERADQEGLIGDIVATWQKLTPGKQTICFATNVAHSEHIAHRFNSAGVDAVHIDAYTDSKSRRDAILQFKRGEIKVLTSVGVLHTGFDAPNAEVAILARPTKSLSLHIQMIGRILRPYPGKERGVILDHAGNVARLGFHTDPMPTELDDGTTTETAEEKQAREEKLPKPCPKCHVMKPAGVGKCPMCGYVYITPNKVEEQAGELTKLKKANRNTTPEEKREFFGGLKQYAMDKGFKSGWASHKYKEKFGVWPNAYKDAKPVPPNDMVKGFIQYTNIKRAKSRSVA